MIRKLDPTNGHVLGHFPITTPAEVDEAVARAKRAFPAWSKSSLAERITILEKLRPWIQSHGEDYAREISKDTGKPLADSLLTELMSIPLFIDYYAKTAASVLDPRPVPGSIMFPGKRARVEQAPLGVVGIISPWNFPFQLSVVPMISALLAGNTVILKPSELTPLTGEVIRECFENIGLPAGVVQVIQGDGSTGAALANADLQKIFFTGSLATGRKIMAAAAQKPIPVELELGGKDAMIVCDDANLARAAKGAAWGAFVNAGQMCVSVERLFVHAKVYDEFIALLQAEIEALVVGGPDDYADMGPLVSEAQLEIVERHVQSAREEGATIRCGGARVERAGNFFAPTLITDVRPDMTIYREETFGPVLPVIRVQSDEEAVELANGHIYGLNASIWTRDIKKGSRLASQIEAGQVCVNDLVSSVGNPALPFGGFKGSGFGRYHGPEGLLAFSQPRAVVLDRGWLNAEPFWFPYEGKYPVMLDLFNNLLKRRLPLAVVALGRLQSLTMKKR